MSKERLIDILEDYFGTNDAGGSYVYELTRIKSAFGFGTMSIDDFEEFTKHDCIDLAEFLIRSGLLKGFEE